MNINEKDPEKLCCLTQRFLNLLEHETFLFIAHLVILYKNVLERISLGMQIK